jgi:hypothetical protein
MKKEALKRIFDFLEEKENHNIPFLWKLINNEPLTKEELIVKGNLNLKGSKITSLPEGLEVGGSLSLIGLAITSLPKSLKVDGTIYLKDSKITSLPEGFKVGRDLSLFGCEQITSLPKGLKVGGNLDLRHTKITSLSEGLEVGGMLYMGSTKLEKYTDDELREMVKPGFIEGEIYRQ